MVSILRFLLLFEVLGLAGVPLAARALGRLPGEGLAFARILAWLLLAWLVWMLGSLGIGNGLPLVLVCCALLAAAAFLLHRRRPRDFAADPFTRRLWLTCEAIFFVAFLVGVAFAAYSPDVLQTEKPMDMMLANSTLASSSFPPADPWLSGAQVNYYYLGQHMVALLIRLTGVEPTQGYNLALGALFAITVTGAFALAATLAESGRRQGMAIRRPLLAGALCVVLLALMGNLRGGWQALHADKLVTFDWFGPSRVIGNTINEFPFFSWTVGDLHAHVIALPLTLLALAFIAQVALHGPPRLARGRGRWETFCAALAIGWLYAVNSWSWPVAAGLLVLGAGVWISGREAVRHRRRAVLWTLLVLGLGFLLVAPFVLSFDPNAQGFAFTRESQREPLGRFVGHHLVIEGALLWLLVAPLLARLLALRHRRRVVVWGLGALAVMLPLLAGARLAGAGLFALGLAATLAAAGRARRAPATERLLWVLAAGAFACLLGAEVGVVRDEFAGGPFERMNTVFKMGYQAWLLLAVFGAVALSAAPAWLPRIPRAAWLTVAAVLVGISLAYPVAASDASRQGFRGDPRLDGRLWLARSAPGDIVAIDWIRANLPGDAVILEAVGDDYSAFGNARVSTYTGRPTVLGWQGHELQWNHDVGDRRQDVQTLYSSPDPATVKALLAKYRVGYAIVGPLERTTYGPPGALLRAGRLILDRGGTQLYAFGS